MTPSEKVREAVERLRQNIADEEYQSWGQKADIETLIQSSQAADCGRTRKDLIKSLYCDWCDHAKGKQCAMTAHETISFIVDNLIAAGVLVVKP